MELIRREQYLDFLHRHKDKDIIKVVSGIRRCGKSTLFTLFKQDLIASGIKEEQIISINFEDLAFEHLQEYHAMHEYVVQRLQPNAMNYIFLDEIQHVPEFERAVGSLFVQDNTDIYITGSNSYFMSSDIATLLTGRYVQIEMLPLSFKEFYESKTQSAPLALRTAYDMYIRESSFPYTQRLDGNAFDIQDYLQGLYNTLLLNDVVARLNVNDVTVLQDIIKYMMSNIGSLLSPTKISNTLTSMGRKTAGRTVERYIKGLEDSLLMYRVDRYDIRGKNVFKTNAKYYGVDMALRNILVGNPGRDTGHILENIVYLELRRRGYTVHVGQLSKGEIDFVAFKPWEGLSYYQVSESVLDPNTLERELAPLEAIPDQYPKYLLTMDEIFKNNNYNGIRQHNVLEWLLEM